jgi:hypothetical protein
MVQRGEIKEYMLTPILGLKAEMAESEARMNAAKQLAAQGGAMPTVMEQNMGRIAQAENPAPPMPQQQMQQQMPQQPMPQQLAQAPMPQGPEDVGIATQATQPMQMAGGGIVAFDDGGDVDIDPDDDYQDMIDQAEADSMNEEMYDLINQMREQGGRGKRDERAAVGIRSGENKNIKEDTRGRAKQVTDEDQARKYNVGNLRPSGFTYPGQVGLSKGKFAMFDSPESGMNALNQDIGIKLNRGLDTPT